MCSAIEIITVPINVIILQHVKEQRHAKNTARLVSLCVPTTNVISTNDNDAINTLRDQCDATNSAVIYPSKESIAIESGFKTSSKGVNTIIFIDGSWKQAFGIMQEYNWLQTLPAFHFSQAPTTNYDIRHTGVRKALSTLEAVAYTLSFVFKANVAPLHNAQRLMQQHWQGPQSHRRGSEKNPIP